MILYDTGMLDAVGTIVITVFAARFEPLREGVAGNQGVSIFVRDQSNKPVVSRRFGIHVPVYVSVR